MHSNNKLHPQWIVGFVYGEGCFTASLIYNKTTIFKTQIQLEFVVIKHKPDEGGSIFRWRVRQKNLLSFLLSMLIRILG